MDKDFFNSGMKWLRADFHLHTKVDKEFQYSDSDSDFYRLYVERLEAEGVSIGVITNHNKFDREEYRKLRKEASKKNIWLLPGVELSVNDGSNGVHCLIVFDKDKWLGTDDDFINQIFIASTHAYVTFITTEGRAYWLKIHEISEASKISRGSHIKGLLSLNPNEEITTVVTMEEFSEDYFLLMATANGTIKKIAISDLSNAKTRGILAIRLKDGDRLVSASLTKGNDELLLITRRGKALRYNEEKVRVMGRSSSGTRGIKLATDDELVAAMTIDEDSKLIIITENGYGKRVDFDNFTPHGKGTGGMKVYNISEKSGEIVGAISIAEKDDLVCITSQGKTLRLKSKKIPIRSRTAGGIHMFNIDSPDMVIGLDKVVKQEVDKSQENVEEPDDDDAPMVFEDDAESSISEADDIVDDEAALDDEE